MLAGELTPGAVASVWEEIAAGEMTGLLEVTSGKDQWEFQFREGVMTGARKRGINTAEHMVELMLEGGILRHETVRDALKKQSKVMKSCLEILMEEGHVPLILYSRIISASLRLLLMDVMALKKGHYQFAAKDDLREEPGTKPLDAARLTAFRDRFETDPKMLAQLRAALFSPIAMQEALSFPIDRKTLFYSYGTQDKDLFEFLVRMADLVRDGVIEIDRGMFGAGPQDILAALFLRGVALFMAAAVLVAVFVARPKSDAAADLVNLRALRYKVALQSTLTLFDTGEAAEIDRLQRAGLITPAEAALLQTRPDEPTNLQ
jgi:hypothetical protein